MLTTKTKYESKLLAPYLDKRSIRPKGKRHTQIHLSQSKKSVPRLRPPTLHFSVGSSLAYYYIYSRYLLICIVTCCVMQSQQDHFEQNRYPLIFFGKMRNCWIFLKVYYTQLFVQKGLLTLSSRFWWSY